MTVTVAMRMAQLNVEELKLEDYIKNVSSSSGNGGTIAIAVPNNVQDGDVLFVLLGCDRFETRIAVVDGGDGTVDFNPSSHGFTTASGMTVGEESFAYLYEGDGIPDEDDIDWRVCYDGLSQYYLWKSMLTSDAGTTLDIDLIPYRKLDPYTSFDWVASAILMNGEFFSAFGYSDWEFTEYQHAGSPCTNTTPSYPYSGGTCSLPSVTTSEPYQLIIHSVTSRGSVSFVPSFNETELTDINHGAVSLMTSCKLIAPSGSATGVKNFNTSSVAYNTAMIFAFTRF